MTTIVLPDEAQAVARAAWKEALRAGGYDADVARMDAAEEKRQRKAARRKALA